MSTEAQRNLLVGVIAVQMELLDADLAAAALRDWTEDKSTKLEDVLRRRGQLSEDAYRLLVGLAQQYLELNDNDAARCLASLSAFGPLADQLSSLDDAEIDHSVTLVRSMRPAAGRAAANPSGMEPASVSVGEATSGGMRFKVLRPHAKGGLGQVSVALDAELNREVALKEIQPNHADDQDSRSRFVLEAEITGGLEHPGIVPVYGLGQTDSGRPFYAMRFVRGDSLKEAADRFHRARRTNDAEQQQALAFRQLLGRFTDVCNAIEYAHSRGVLHRDLKPGNVMLGKYGETLVVDWGLAKAMGEQAVEGATEQVAEPSLRPSSGSGTAPTIMGQAIGTPAFMPPEQAAGRLDDVGPASDVYSLGATLFYLLTGQPPVDGDSLGEVLQRVEAGDFRPPRTLTPTTPKPLDAICRKAMSHAPGDRYASPQLLAADVERFLADEPVTAYREPLLIRARRWMRKHQTLAATTAAVLLLSLFGSGAFSLILNGKNRELADRNTQLVEARNLAEANEVAARAQSQLALTTLSEVIRDLQVGLTNLPGGGEVRRRLLSTSLKRLEMIATRFVGQASVDRDTMLALQQMGQVVLRFGATENGDDSAADKAIQSSTVRVAEQLLRRAHQISLALVEAKQDDSIAQRELAVSHDWIGEVEEQLGRSEAARDAYMESLAIRKSLYEENPESELAQHDLSISYTNVGNIAVDLGESEKALRWYQLGLEVSERFAAAKSHDAESQRALSIDYENIGKMQLLRGETEAGLKKLQRSVEIVESLLTSNPSDTELRRDFVSLMIDVAEIQRDLGDSQAALTGFQRSVETATALLDEDPDDRRTQRHLIAAHNSIARMFLLAGDMEAAGKHVVESVRMSRALFESDPQDVLARRALADSLDHHGEWNALQQEFDEAEDNYREGLKIHHQLVAEDPALQVARSNLSITYRRLGDLQMLNEQPEEALKSFQEAKRIRQALREEDPANLEYLSLLAIASDRVGEAMLALGRMEEALAALDEGLRLSKRYVAADPANVGAKLGVAVGLARLGDLRVATDEHELAIDYYQQALTVSREMVAADQENEQARQNVMGMLFRLGQSHAALENWSEAAGNYEQAAEIVREKIARGINVEAARGALQHVEQLAKDAREAAAKD